MATESPPDAARGCAHFMPLPALDDPDGERVARDLPPVVDAHVHLFPDRVFHAIWRWFDAHGWPIRRKLTSPEVVDFLAARGVAHVVALIYAHRPGLARGMNAYMAEIARTDPRVTGVGTVMPGEPDAGRIVDEAAAMGLHGIKLHCHVQCFAPDAPELHEVYEACVRNDVALVIHAGREPRSDAYACDPYALCAAERIERVLRGYPRLRLCVPHLGTDEIEPYFALVEHHDNLWLDTTMAMADYFPMPTPQVLRVRPDRLMYGTDFPNIPYAWDRELVRIARVGFAPDALEAVLGGTARAFFRVASAGATGGAITPRA